MKTPRERRSETNKREALPMAKKRMYKTTPVKRVNVQLLCEDVEGQHVALGVDVAKTGMVGALVDETRAVRRTISWSHPKDTGLLLELLEAVREHAASVSVAMEPSGTYGDALRWQLLSCGFDVHRVSAKHTHDMAEVYDGVPSKHDAKDAAIVAQLHLDGRSTPWGLRPRLERELTAAVRLLDVYDGQLRRDVSRLEALLARHWPELTGWLELGSATLPAVSLRPPAATGTHPTASACRRPARAHATQALRQWDDGLPVQRGGAGAAARGSGPARTKERCVLPWGAGTTAPPTEPGGSGPARGGEASREAHQEPRSRSVAVACVGRLALARVRGGWLCLRLRGPTRAARRGSPTRDPRCPR